MSSAVVCCFLLLLVPICIDGFGLRAGSYTHGLRLHMSTVDPGPRPSGSENNSNGGFTMVDPAKGESELRIIQNFGSIQLGGASKIAIIGTQTCSSGHQEMIELLSYALVLSGNHVFTSAGAPDGTNVGVIRGALRANNPDLLSKYATREAMQLQQSFSRLR
jgi:hypothetical protein